MNNSEKYQRLFEFESILITLMGDKKVKWDYDDDTWQEFLNAFEDDYAAFVSLDMIIPLDKIIAIERIPWKD